MSPIRNRRIVSFQSGGRPSGDPWGGHLRQRRRWTAPASKPHVAFRSHCVLLTGRSINTLAIVAGEALIDCAHRKTEREADARGYGGGARRPFFAAPASTGRRQACMTFLDQFCLATKPPASRSILARCFSVKLARRRGQRTLPVIFSDGPRECGDDGRRRALSNRDQRDLANDLRFSHDTMAYTGLAD